MKDIPGYEGLYAATRDGKIWSYRFNRYLSPSVNVNYLAVGLGDINGKYKGYLIHRIIATTYLGLDLNDSKMTVDHIDGDKCNNSVKNLRLLSMGDNNRARSGRLGVDTESHKMCSKCKVVKLRSEFGKNKTSLDGLGSWCKPCANIKGKLYYGSLILKPKKILPTVEVIKEEMCDIPGYEDFYAATKSGKIWSHISNRYLVPSVKRDYLLVGLIDSNGKGKHYDVQRLIMMTYGGLNSSNWDMTVDHIDGDKHNNSVENLQLLSNGDNTRAYYKRKKTMATSLEVNSV